MAVIHTIRKAVRPHHCGWIGCRKIIKSGQRYVRTFYTRDEPGGIYTRKECSACSASAGRGRLLV